MAPVVKADPANGKGIVLVPVDFSPVAGMAMDHGLLIARRMNWPVRLLHVYGHMPGRDFSREHAESNGKRQELLDRIARWQEEYGLDAALVETEGNLFDSIRTAASRLNPAVMVMGTHGKQGLQRLYGSYALRVVLDAPCPVLVVPEGPAGPDYRNVLVPVCHGLDPEPLLDWLLLPAQLFGPEIHLFPVIDNAAVTDDNAGKILSEMAGKLENKKRTVTVAPACHQGNFTPGVLGYAGNNGIGLVMTSTTLPEGVTGFDCAGWIERLMFNRAAIPVVFINGTFTGL